MSLPIVSDILSNCTVWKLSQLIVQILDTAFLSPLWGVGLGITYDVHLWLIGKRVGLPIIVLI